MEITSRQRFLLRKLVEEPLLAPILDYNLSKEDILYVYLNRVFFGGSAYDDRQNSLRIGRFLYRTLWQYPKPIVLQVHGYCIGGGITLMAACEMRARVGSVVPRPARNFNHLT